jgi:phosphatidylserine decarboxylase
MKTLDPIRYYDRRSGRQHTEKVFASSFLNWSYNSNAGRSLTALILSRKFVSALYGLYGRSRLSRKQVASFARKMNVDTTELLLPLEGYTSYNDFFTREIDVSRRITTSDPQVCIAPADGKMLAYTEVTADRTFRIKRSLFNLRRFLTNDRLAERFDGGTMIISRLCLADYHHFHFPVAGVPTRSVAVSGRYYAGGPYTRERLTAFYTDNYRMVTLINSEQFGTVAMAEIGAFTVGSIKQDYVPYRSVGTGDHKGHFELGGSTVVLLFERGAVRVDDDILEHTAEGLETYIRFGESTGRVPGYIPAKSALKGRARP